MLEPLPLDVKPQEVLEFLNGAVLAVTAEPSGSVMSEIEQFCSAETELPETIAKEIIFRRIWY